MSDDEIFNILAEIQNNDLDAAAGAKLINLYKSYRYIYDYSHLFVQIFRLCLVAFTVSYLDVSFKVSKTQKRRKQEGVEVF